jgi:HlyD family secretion protein
VPASELVAFTGGTAFQGARIDRLLVKEGDLVEQGQPIARSDKYEVDAVAVARCRADLARAQLQQVKAGAKSHEIDAQMARCRAAESEMMHAARECRRYAYLLEQGAVSKSLAEEKQLTYEVDRQKLEQAQQTLWSLSEVRAQDVLSAQEELHVRQAELKRALDQLSLDVAVAPLRGTLLQINTHEGEQIGAGGIATIGDTGSMYANLEVFDADIARLRCGQAVELTSPAFSGYMHGKVCRIDSLVQTRAFSQQDPADDIDARVIKVRVKLDTCDSKRAARFCNLRVTARVLS